VNPPTTKPYLIRAIYEWCIDNGYTPYASVAVDERTRVPRSYVKDGQIVLNVGPEAAHQLHMGNDFLTFAARFGGVAENLSVPVGRVVAIYARENGHGMAFELEESAAEPDSSPAPNGAEENASEPETASARPTGARPHLTRVK
jgi:stringent starvation protein B